MANIFSSLLRRSGRRKVYADLLHLDDRMLSDIGLTRAEIAELMTGRGSKVPRAHE